MAVLANEQLRVVSPNLGFISGARTSIMDIWNHRELWWLLTNGKSRQGTRTRLGFVWTLVRPLINLLIYFFAIGKILGAARAIDNFAVYVLAGLTGAYRQPNRCKRNRFGSGQLWHCQEGVPSTGNLPALRRWRGVRRFPCTDGHPDHRCTSHCSGR